MVDRCREKVVLRIEMCVKPAMGKTSAAHDFSNADVGNATFPERGGSGFHNALACCLLMILRPRHVRWLPSLEYRTRSGTDRIPAVIVKRPVASLPKTELSYTEMALCAYCN